MAIALVCRYYHGLVGTTRCFRESVRGGAFAQIMGFDHQTVSGK